MNKTISDVIDLMVTLEDYSGEPDELRGFDGRYDAGSAIAEALRWFYVARRGEIIEQMKPMKYDDPDYAGLEAELADYEKKTSVMDRRSYEIKLEDKWVLSYEECFCLAGMIRKMIERNCSDITDPHNGFSYHGPAGRNEVLLSWARDEEQELKREVEVMMTLIKWSVDAPAKSEIPTVQK